MHTLLTALMALVIVIALGTTATARGRWSGPWWWVLAAAMVAYPFTHTLLDRVPGAPDGLLRWAFQIACGMLLATLCAPLYHRFRTSPDTGTDTDTGNAEAG
ncbi:hypothetical protein [Streptomyces fumanus]|uniref:Uncharacterized protein n=1 Tax=Streptomyces fumanus TaxID=67302 RepID=A0A919B195_9ACTN|nr:hypothetical protein [Streptomyces fumanus]GHF34251.1 hypothetical protein GCM10018772_69870 [Streptomyces fumanus]